MTMPPLATPAEVSTVWAYDNSETADRATARTITEH